MFASTYPRPGLDSDFNRQIRKFRSLIYFGDYACAISLADVLLAKYPNAEVHCLLLRCFALSLDSDSKGLEVSLHSLSEALEYSCSSNSVNVDTDIVDDAKSLLIHNGHWKHRSLLGSSLISEVMSFTPSSYTLDSTRKSLLSLSSVKRFKPPLTGFFSYIEHITLIIFFAKLLNRPVEIDPQNWKYPLEILESLTSDSLATVLRDGQSDSEGYNSGDLIRSLKSCRDSWCYVYQTKKLLYMQLLRHLEIYHGGAYESEHQPDSIVVFIRAGDKYVNESIEFKADKIWIDLHTNLIERNGLRKIKLIGDDAALLDKIALFSQDISVVNSPYPINGFNLHDRSQITPCQQLANISFIWRTFCKSPFIGGCVDSNICNTAFYVLPQSAFISTDLFFARSRLWI